MNCGKSSTDVEEMFWLERLKSNDESSDVSILTKLFLNSISTNELDKNLRRQLCVQETSRAADIQCPIDDFCFFSDEFHSVYHRRG